MFQDSLLANHLQTSSSVKNQSLVTMEWNLNDASNIDKIGNYRYRPLEGTRFNATAISQYDSADTATLYTGATDADVLIDGGIKDDNTPITFKSINEQNNLFFSLEDCFGKFRPRSGINKLTYLGKSIKYIPELSRYMAQRPRYYFVDKNDKFKYWSSYRSESGTTRGLSGTTKRTGESGYDITDAAPFVIYKNNLPSNKIAIKIQTNVGTVNNGTYSINGKTVSDPFYGNSNATVPTKWKLQKLDGNNWVDIVGYTNMPSTIPADGYVEFSYGLQVPTKYQDSFVYAGEYSSTASLPKVSYNGYAYLIKQSQYDIGTFAIWTNQDYNNPYEFFNASYGWSTSSQTIGPKTNFITDFIKDNSKFIASGVTKYRQFDLIKGLRIIVDEMNTKNSSFDLIELSPRIFANVSDKTTDYSVTKQLSDLGNAGLPVGQLLAATGAITLFDYEQAFSSDNANSILYNVPNKNIQTKFYEAILDVVDNSNNSYDYYIPVKTLYSEDFPEVNSSTRSVSIKLRDLYLLFETTTAPQILLVNKTIGYILSILFDSIGFSNYRYDRLTNEHDEIIPYFFIGPDTSIAQVLQQLAVSTQSAMFFDENNDFVVMTKNYLLPSESDRATDITISGNDNIIGISSSQNAVYNSGKITYVSRYIQKTYGSIEQSSYAMQDKTWIYKPVLLWEVSPPESLRPTNGESSNDSGYSLTAMPLNTTLTSDLPTVVNGKITNNIISFGDNIDWISRYSGYFYANAEIIKYDAVEHYVSGIGNVWISDAKEYEYYFSKLSLRGKIYPTGNVRIYSEPNVNANGTIKEGPVAKHGRMQFGTGIADPTTGKLSPATHEAGLSSSWTDTNNLSGIYMNSDMLLNGVNAPTWQSGPAGLDTQAVTKKTSVTSIMKNFLSTINLPESVINSQKTGAVVPGTVQASALIMTGTSFSSDQKPIDYVSYVSKSLNNKFVHFGTRLRIIGSVGNTTDYSQQPIGSSTLYTLKASQQTKTITNPDGSHYDVTVSTKDGIIGGSSGGMGILVNPKTNNGYYFEIAALTDNNVNNYAGTLPINNIFFYKTGAPNDSSGRASVTVLWNGLAPILVDDGKYTGQSRTYAEKNPTVYDLAVEYEDVAGARIFYLYVNNKIIATVTDTNPIPHVEDNNMALFVRGSSRVMFENVYALTTNYAKDTSGLIMAPAANAPVSTNVFGSSSVNITDSFRKYAMSGIINSTYLNTISASTPPKYNIYYEEFGTIMREVAYMNIRYDKAYPALVAKLSPTFNDLKGYTVSGFKSNPYGAEFLIFNNTDTILTLDEASGNYLRIQGVTFTQQSQNELTVDDYFSKVSDFSSYKYDSAVSNQANKDYSDIKVSRLTYGKKDFTLDAPYIQSQDSANGMMDWIIKKVMKPRLSVGIDVFALPNIQLGDIVKVNYQANGVNEISNSRFIVYNIQYSKNGSGPKTTLYLSEVI